MRGNVRYVNVFVRDLERAVAFYGSTLGLEPLRSDTAHGYASFDAGAVSLGVAEVLSEDAEQARLVGRHTGVGFAVPDLAAAHVELVGRGVEFEMEPQRQPWGGFMALFRDPEGNVFYLDELPEE